jgi:hypothetical protein
VEDTQGIFTMANIRRKINSAISVSNDLLQEYTNFVIPDLPLEVESAIMTLNSPYFNQATLNSVLCYSQTTLGTGNVIGGVNVHCRHLSRPICVARTSFR